MKKRPALNKNMPKFIRNPEKTAIEIPLLVEIDQFETTRGSYEFWGTVRNDRSTAYKDLRLIYTALDASGKLMKRDDIYITPDTITKGCVSFFSGSFDCKDERAGTILYNITGTRITEE